MSDATRHPKYQPIVWATIEDALRAQDYEARGMEPNTIKDSEGYLVVIGARPKQATPLPYLRNIA